MTIFVIWQLIVTLDSIRNSCDVLFWDSKFSCNCYRVKSWEVPCLPKILPGFTWFLFYLFFSPGFCFTWFLFYLVFTNGNKRQFWKPLLLESAEFSLKMKREKNPLFKANEKLLHLVSGQDFVFCQLQNQLCKEISLFSFDISSMP